MDYEDLMTAEEEKLLAKQAKCEHNKEWLIFITCSCCGKHWSEKNLHLGLKNEIIEPNEYKSRPKIFIKTGQQSN